MPLVFKPAKRELEFDTSAPHYSIYSHFKVQLGIYVEGRTSPSISNAQVSIQRQNRTSLKDRVPTLILTDSEGRFRLGPVEEDFYDVGINKEGYNFVAKEILKVGRS